MFMILLNVNRNTEVLLRCLYRLVQRPCTFVLLWTPFSAHAQSGLRTRLYSGFFPHACTTADQPVPGGAAPVADRLAT